MHARLKLVSVGQYVSLCCMYSHDSRWCGSLHEKLVRATHRPTAALETAGVGGRRRLRCSCSEVPTASRPRKGLGNLLCEGEVCCDRDALSCAAPRTPSTIHVLM